MKVRFSIREKLYAMCDFEIECKSKEDVEEALDEIGDCVSAEDLDMELKKWFGAESVKSDGLNGTNNIEPAEEYDFWNWED